MKICLSVNQKREWIGQQANGRQSARKGEVVLWNEHPLGLNGSYGKNSGQVQFEIYGWDYPFH
jgi:hypothetical protein